MGGQAVTAVFGQDGAAGVLPPGPLLAELTAQAALSPGSLADDELIGVLHAARRLASHAAWQQTVVIAEFARRRQAAFEAARAAGVPVACRDGEFPGEELAMELTDTGAYAGARIDTAVELTARLPETLAGLESGAVDLDRACVIASRTLVMTGEAAAYADKVLAAAAPELRPDQLARKAAALEMKLAPDAVRARRELARRLDQRVEARREQSGNASLSGRELDTADVIASKAHIDAIALKLRDSGLIAGNLGRLRALALTDLTQGRDPLDRIQPPRAAASQNAGTGNEPAAGPAAPPDADPVAGEEPHPDPTDPVSGPAGPSEPGGNGGETGDAFRCDPAPAAGGPTSLPALINLLVPAATLLGWGTAPGQAAGWGLLDAEETKTLVKAASTHPRTRWCVTLTAPDGTAIAHGCAAGHHPWPQNGRPPPGSPPRDPDTRGTTTQAAQLTDLLRRLNTRPEPIARSTCDHRNAENRYTPSRKLTHLLRARNQTCTAPACNNQAIHSDLDHTIPHPDGPTDQCNLTPKCRRHHRTKQAPGWKVTQPTPDTTTWTTPSGRTHTTTATKYDL